MTVLDTLYLLFKTDASQAKTELEQLNQKIEKLKESGKKRSEQENKDLKEMIARQKDLQGVLKESQKTSSQLTDSLASAAAALVGFGAIRSGIVNVSEFNSGLAVQSKLLGQNAKDLEILSHAAKLAGGSSEGALSNIAGIGKLLLNTPNGGGSALNWLPNVAADLDKKAGNDMIARRRVLQMQYPMITDAGLQNMLLNPAEMKRIMAESSRQVNDKNSDYSRDRRIQEDVSKIEKSTQGIFDKINRLLPESVSAFGQSGAGGVIGGALATLGGIKALAWLRGGATAVGAAASGAGAATGALAVAIPVGAYQVARGTGDLVTGRRDSLMGRASKAIADWIVFGDYKKPSAKAGMDDMEYWQSQGYTREQAAAIVGNMMAESKGNPAARGDGGRAHGLFQHHPDRRAKILAATGIDISTASKEQQREAAAWEMRNGVNGFRDAEFRRTRSVAEATQYFGHKYEGFAGSANYGGAEMMRRVGYASNAMLGATGGAGGTSNVQIDRIEVNTKATDAKGISQAIGGELHSTLRKINTHFDNGEKY